MSASPGVPAVAPAARPHPPREERRETLAALARSKTFIAGTVVVGFWILCAIFQARFLKSPFDTVYGTLQSPSAAHWFGTDRLGRDVFARVIAGARDILVVAFSATVIGTVLGTALGLVMGYMRGLTDDVLGRVVDAVLALPVVIVALLALVALGPSDTTATFVIGFVFAPLIGRTVRAAVLSERELEYVSAARLRNERAPYIMLVEVLPNVLEPVIVEFTVRLGYAIFAVATLSFLGFGLQAPSPDWGLQVADHYQYLSGNIWWPTLFPGVAIASLVIGVNLVADGLSQVLGR
ncbi:MAG: ABC transporter permease [Gaiellales bacterium]